MFWVVFFGVCFDFESGEGVGHSFGFSVVFQGMIGVGVCFGSG